MNYKNLIGAAAFLAVAGTSASAQTVTGGFYRQSDKPEVMYQFSSGAYCHVQNETQMAAFGGFGVVKVVPKMVMAGKYTGDCGWPNGFYRQSNAPHVFRLYGTTSIPNIGTDICHVVNEQQMRAFGGFRLVKVIQPTSDLGLGRRAITECANP